MSSNDFKRSTGYYILNGIEFFTSRLFEALIVVLVLRAEGLSRTLSNIYVKIEVKDVSQRSEIIRDASGSWNECFPM